MIRLAFVCARFYPSIIDMLENGARNYLLREVGENHIAFDVFNVPGALEIPAAIKKLSRLDTSYDGYLALGCVIRGKTSHYETVSNLSAWGLQYLACRNDLLIGNGILTVNTKSQAIARADPNRINKGAEAANALLSLIRLSN